MLIVLVGVLCLISMRGSLSTERLLELSLPKYDPLPTSRSVFSSLTILHKSGVRVGGALGIG